MELDEGVLAALIEEAERTESDALIVIKDGRTVVERTFGREVGPIETMSVTKSVVSLAVGLLLDEGKTESLEAPLSTWFPDWAEGDKAAVTLRHVLTHTSGLEHRQGARVLNTQDDRLAFVRESPISEPPGTVFSYNNEATQLLSGVIEAAAGEPVDAYLDSRLFQPMGIADWSWERDPVGNAQTFYGLSLHPADLARIGLLMLDGGRWEGEVLVVFPERRLVAVRMHRTAHGGDEQENERCGFRGLLRGLQEAMGGSR